MSVTRKGKEAAMFARLSFSHTADAGGFSNAPTHPDDIIRLWETSKNAVEVMAIVREKWPRARVTSGFRSPALLKALREKGFDPSPTSLHLRGLGIDFDVGDFADNRAAALYLKNNAGRLTVRPRDVLAEIHRPHVHIDWFDPLGKLDNSYPRRATRWAVRNPPGQQPRLTELV